ncbi:SEL1-like repeat protein [Labrys monachus]|uniref:Localization factor PodJL n=1 Tax=Labrys monachus TaxID=217067 RepID=A0ABU0FD94_9HYPH|nr:tetratricopeptide repeat protein [Labrys monachus]MDQ0392577.1 localization factor PodJL [Labrys monachus]
MKQSVPWSVKGVGPDAREAAKELARRSGMTLGQWLNAMIAGQDGGQAVKERPPASESPLAAIARRLEAMKSEGHHPGTLRSAIASGVSEAVVAQHIRASEARTADLFDRLMRRQEESEAHIASLIGGIVDRLADPEAMEAVPAAETRQEHHEYGDAGPVGRVLGDLAARLNAGRDEDVDIVAADLERRLAAMGRDLDADSAASHGGGPAGVATADRSGAPGETGLAALRGDIADLERKLGERLAQAGAPGPIAAIDRKLDLLVRQVQDPTVLATIQRDVADIRERSRGPDLSQVIGRLDHLLARFQPIEAALEDLTAQAPRALEKIGRRLEILQSTVESGQAAASASLAGLMAELDARLEALQRGNADRQGGRGDDAALVALERQVRQMAEELEALRAFRPDASGLAPVLHEALGGMALQSLPEELRRLFGELRAFQDNEARGTRRTMEALQRTLRELADRLAAVEDMARTRAGPAIPEHLPDLGEGAALFGRDRPDDIVWSDELPRALAGDAGPTARNGEKPAELPVPHVRGRPSQVSVLGSEARSSFIAAARRAVRAAAEADGSLTREAKNTGNSEVEPFYQRHKRSILLGLAAVTMMMGALQGGRVHVLPGEARNMSTGPSVDAERSPVSPALTAARNEAKSFYEEACNLDQPDASTLDLVRACGLYRQAALRGYVPAFFRLGLAYDRGRGVGHDAVLAGVWYQRAADHGSVKAMHNLAVLYATGAVTDGPDYRQTARWFRQAAERGHAPSQYNYALLAAQGLGTPRDLGVAYRFLSLAAEQGDAEAVAKRNEIGTRLTPSEKAAIDGEMTRS